MHNKLIALLLFISLPYLFLNKNNAMAAQSESRSLGRIPLTPLHPLSEKTKVTGNISSIAQSAIPLWLMEVSIKNAPSMFKGILHYLKSYPSHKAIPSFHRFILVGPPGTGKTTLARAFAHYVQAEVHFISATSFLGRYRNETAVSIRTFFEKFYNTSEKTIIIIDELHKLFENYENKHSDNSENAATFWLALDTLENNPNVVVIGTANRIKKLPPELKSRFHGKIIKMALPTKGQKTKAFKDILKNDTSISLDESIDESFIKIMITHLQNGSLRDIQLLIDTAKMFHYAQMQSANNQVIKLHRNHFEQALQQLNGETEEHKETFIERIYPTLKPYSLILSMTVNILTLSHMCKQLGQEVFHLLR
jgi:SpoVK/Ycf46/Vps4 family AAA+-type ATPase